MVLVFCAKPSTLYLTMRKSVEAICLLLETAACRLTKKT